MWLELFILGLPISITSVRVDEFHWEQESPCEATCVKPELSSSGARQGLYELFGDAAREASSDPHAEFYVADDCEGTAGPTHWPSPVVVPWVDGEDPINKSRLEVYIDPKVEQELRFRGASGYICQQHGSRKACICKLSGFEATDWNLLGHLASVLPFSGLMDLQLSSKRRCGDSGRQDLGLAFWTVLFVSFLALCIEAAWALRFEAAPASKWPGDDAAVKIDSPWKIFSTGFGWILGFITSVMTLQTVVLFLTKKSDTPEIVIWLLIYFPCLLAAGGAYRLTNLMCKKQLMHAFLGQGLCLTGSSPSRLDSLLLFALAVYALGVVFSLGSQGSLKTSAVALALASPAWTLVKALRNAQETEERMDQLISVSRLEQLSAKAPQLLLWRHFVSAARRGVEPGKEDGDLPHLPQVDFNLFRDVRWHRTRLAQLGVSWPAVLVLPTFALMVFGFAAISSVQAMSYACSRGELADLQLASSLLSIDFKPWQQKYVVQMDVSFKQATLVALADSPSTRWIAFTQPGAQQSEPLEAVEDDKGAVIAELRLSRQRIPRVATVRTQGLRPSLPPTEQLIGFSPLQTLPARLQLTGAGNFHKLLAWSTVPRSTISLPPGMLDFNLSITLQDFYLGLPYRANAAVDRSLWTVFEPTEPVSEESCRQRCEENLDCLAAFPGPRGCFEAYNNHRHHEAGSAPVHTPLAAGNRTLRGQLAGCRLLVNDSSAGSCTPAPIPAQQHVLNFGLVRPDWLGDTARLEFSLLLEVGEQEFLSEVMNIDLRQGQPVPINMVTLLRDDGKVVATKATVGAMTTTVKVMDYDPKEVNSALRLLVMPLLPDRGFQVQWPQDLNASTAELELFRSAEQCVNSMLVQRRYEVCGMNGPLKDQPVAVNVAPWTGELLETLDFFVASSVDPATWPASQRWTVKLEFDGVDSPAAWAAKKYGCKVLDDQSWEVTTALASSSDALCTLMSQSCGEQLCHILQRSLGTGQSRTYLEANLKLRNGAMLPADGIIKALNCAQETKACKVSSFWEYQGAGLKLQGTGATVPVETFVSSIVNFGLIDFLKQQSFSASHIAQSLNVELASALWRTKRPSSEMLRVMCTKSMTLPGRILETMIQLRAGDSIEANASSLQDCFTNVRTLSRSLEDARQLKQVALALQMAPTIQKLSLSCKACPVIAREALMTDWQLLLPHLKQLERLHLDSFSLTRPGLSARLASALANAQRLNSFTLIDCILADAAPVAQALGQVASLTELDFSQLSADWPLGKAISNLTALRKLTYTFGRPLSVAADLLLQLGQKPLPHLEVVHFEGNELSTESALAFARTLPALSHLRELSLADNRLDDRFAPELIRNLKNENNCVFLDVRRNNFTAEVRRLISGSADLGRSCGLKWVSEEEQMQKGTLRKPANFQLKKRAKEV